MRAMAYCAPKRLAVRQASILISSPMVAAITISAWGASASRSVSALTPLPLMNMASRVSIFFCSTISLRSIMVTLWPSSTKCCAREMPSFPPPITMICMMPSKPSKCRPQASGFFLLYQERGRLKREKCQLNPGIGRKRAFSFAFFHFSAGKPPFLPFYQRRILQRLRFMIY